jgi:DNA-binding HxlR family transcriptional regulator
MQLKMSPAVSMERWARDGATKQIVEDRRKHAAMERALPGVLAAAIREERSNGHGARAVQAEEPAKPKRRLSAAGRKRISVAQKARWRKHRKEAKAS